MSYYSHVPNNEDTICAPATVPGTAAIAIVRISGRDAFAVAGRLFSPRTPFDTTALPPRSVHYGSLSRGGEWLDDALANFYRSPHSYTGEDTVEFFCHGSVYITQKLLEWLVAEGCRMALPGEFTLRAFLNGKLDLSQAEAVADLISARSKSAHDLAMKQLKGGFSQKIENLRRQLLQFTSLIELELDFSEEDVEFADRTRLLELILSIRDEVQALSASFALGNVLKKGIPVTIAGKPNVGKSTLLNLLLNEDRAIVSPIPGTTRDAIEDTVTLDGITFRFIDTAGLRDTSDTIENMGVERTIEKIKQAYIILYVFDISSTSTEELNSQLEEIEPHLAGDNKILIPVGNKSDMLVETPHNFKKLVERDTVFISAKRRENTELLIQKLTDAVRSKYPDTGDTLVSNARHYEALTHAAAAINDVITAMNNDVPHDLLAADLRRALYHLSAITGVQINNEDVLGEIFSSFCIGK